MCDACIARGKAILARNANNKALQAAINAIVEEAVEERGTADLDQAEADARALYTPIFDDLDEALQTLRAVAISDPHELELAWDRVEQVMNELADACETDKVDWT